MNEISQRVQEVLDEIMPGTGVTLTATGDTYPHREKLKYLGFEWDGTMKEWRITIRKVNDEGGLWAPPAVITVSELEELQNAGVEWTVED